ncbi:Endochitinase 1 [Phytophthora nicotianae]|uniref:Endochitinase 1 n=1 Tax=Phytophthora nicotianae TaxID=4792 RepID=A0A0W8DPG5_PHYNI|nr:Endochitinase 1 [Phytophthora nicotianae]
MARFDSGVPRDREETSDNQISSPMIPHVADKYDPDHPDADWGGYVRRSYKKRFYTNQSGVKDYEQGRGSQQNSARTQSPSSSLGSGQGSPSLSKSGSSGSLSGRRIDSRRSLLAGIGKLVAAEDLNGLHPPPERHLPESYTNAASKTLLAEN